MYNEIIPHNDFHWRKMGGWYSIVFDDRMYFGWATDFARRLRYHNSQAPVGAFGKKWQKWKGNYEIAVCTQLPRGELRDMKPRQAESLVTYEAYRIWGDRMLNQQYERYINKVKAISRGAQIPHEMSNFWELILGDVARRAEHGMMVVETQGYKEEVQKWNKNNQG